MVYSIDPISYRVAGVNPARFADLVRVTGDRRANLFADHWEAAVFPSLDPEREALVGISLTARNQLIPGLMLARALRERGHFVVPGGTLITRFVNRLTRLPERFEEGRYSLRFSPACRRDFRGDCARATSRWGELALPLAVAEAIEGDPALGAREVAALLSRGELAGPASSEAEVWRELVFHLVALGIVQIERIDSTRGPRESH